MAMTVNSMANDSLSKVMTQLATGKRINQASDDAAGLAIAEKMKSLASGYDVGTSNAEQTGNLLDTAEGALSGISDMLGRMRELALRASNGIMTTDDKRAIQDEINQIKEEIEKTATGTEYNTMRLLDGSYAGKHLASNPDGSGKDISIANSTLEALGLSDFDVTGDFDISVIDNAIEKVNESRATIGSLTNVIGHIVNANENAYVNQISSLTQIEGLDMAKASMELNRQKVLSQLQLFNTQQQNERAKGVLNFMR